MDERLFAYVILLYGWVASGFLQIAFFAARNRPSGYLLVGIYTISLHAVYKLMWLMFSSNQQFELPAPFSLMAPVMLYMFAYAYYRPGKSVSALAKLAHAIFPMIHLGIFTITLLHPAEVQWWVWYSQWIYGVSIVSLLVYSTLTVSLYTGYNGLFTITDILIRQLTIFGYAFAILISVVCYELDMPGYKTDFAIRPMTFIFIVIGLALMLRYLWANRRLRSAVSEDAPAPREVMPLALREQLAETLEKELDRTRLFLNPSVSLDMLAQQTDIPRHQLTHVFQEHYHQSFYQFIAAARIRYAIKRMLELSDTMTLDSLSYECGFNSKTSFNKYFKAYTGMTPSQYRSGYRREIYQQS
ncbi:helix-turn-helix domain-containing protein [Parapedobacter sp. DT-150]|uniref:helix-turn-helix domain-containing protein n=1 Tax=Parapedobacter sp. DT-150 TaxID=3396162 RepID=UPI003F1BA9FE